MVHFHALQDTGSSNAVLYLLELYVPPVSRTWPWRLLLVEPGYGRIYHLFAGKRQLVSCVPELVRIADVGDNRLIY
jgi:hypothetical protein